MALLGSSSRLRQGAGLAAPIGWRQPTITPQITGVLPKTVQVSCFLALADPTRRGVLAGLAVGDATVKELAEPYDVSVAAVSKHLKVLDAAG